MSYTTTPAFIYKGTWDATTRSHPAMKWMEEYTHFIDKKDYTDAAGWHASDFFLQKPDGSTFVGGPAIQALEQMFAPFPQHLHDPSFLICWDTEKGWNMMGLATFYGKLPGPPGPGGIKDSKGAEWDVSAPSAYLFEYVKSSGAEHGGIVIQSSKIFSDSGPAIMGMLKKGVLTPEQLMQM